MSATTTLPRDQGEGPNGGRGVGVWGGAEDYQYFIHLSTPPPCSSVFQGTRCLLGFLKKLVQGIFSFERVI